MPALIWAHICQDAMIGRNGNISIINDFTRITSPSYPARRKELCVISKWTSSFGEDFTHRVEIQDPAGLNIAKSDTTQLISLEEVANESSLWYGRSGALMERFCDLIIPMKGFYKAVIFINDENANEIEFEALIEEPENDQQV